MYTTKEAALITNSTTAALRYYEKEKLLPPITRDGRKYRQYSDDDIEWIKMIQCMRRANIPIHSIREYVSLLTQGGETLAQRFAMVQDHMADIQNQMHQLQSALDLTQKKLAFYEKHLKDPSMQKISCQEEWKLFNHGEN